MSFGVMKDYKLKLRNLHASHTLGSGFSLPLFPLFFQKKGGERDPERKKNGGEGGK